MFRSSCTELRTLSDVVVSFLPGGTSLDIFLLFIAAALNKEGKGHHGSHANLMTCSFVRWHADVATQRISIHQISPGSLISMIA